MADKPRLSEAAQKARSLFEDGCVQAHNTFTTKLKKRRDAYDAILDKQSEAAQWTSKLTPPFVQHIVDTTLGGIVDDKLDFRVRPKARFYEPGEYERVKAGAEAHEILHHCQLKHDRFNEILRPFALQDAIAGLTVAKTFWKREQVTRPRLKVVPDEKALEKGILLPRLVEETVTEMAFDGPTTEVVNVEDFFWHEAAIELQRSPVIAHRVFMHYSELERLQAQGIYQNVEQLNDVKGSDGTASRRADGTDRARDMVEVLEIWWLESDGRHTCTLGNYDVELRAPRKNRFWHGEYPFVVCSSRAELFAIPGKSQVEKIAALQLAYWDTENATRDNLRLLNNAIFWFDATRVANIDNLVHEPGARWPVEGPINEAIGSWSPDPMSAQISIPHLGKLEQLMQNLAGGQPFTSTAEAGTVNADTATEAALVTNLAQRSTMMLKGQLYRAYERIGQQRTELNQQFIRTPLMAESIGLDNQTELTEIAPLLLQGDYLFDLAPMNQSLMRSERKAEANALLQVVGQLLGPWVMFAQNGLTPMPNMEEFIRYLLEQYDLGDINRFFSRKPAPQAAPPGPPGQPAAVSEPPGGTTGPHSIDPAVSPSAKASQSGESMLQQLFAQRGGVTNT